MCADILIAEMRPTPNPAKNRPATNSGMAVETVCKTTPNENTHKVAKSPSLLPMKSASGAAANAPKNVPADKIDTIRDDSDAERAGFPYSSAEPVVKTDSQCGIAIMPPIVPVSYLLNCKQNTLILLRNDIPEEYTTESDKQTNSNGHGRRTRHISWSHYADRPEAQMI